MGAAEGKCEGEVNTAKRRLMDRYRLDEEKVGQKHVLSELVPIFAEQQVSGLKNECQAVKGQVLAASGPSASLHKDNFAEGHHI